MHRNRDLFAVSLIIPLLSKHAKNIGTSPSVAGMVGSVYGALQLVSSPLIGRWSDVSGRRFVLLCCLALSAVGYFLLARSVTVWLLILARVPTGIFKHTQELARGYLADSTPAAERSKVFGHLNAVSSVGFIIGPTLGGHMVSAPGGFGLAAIITASIFVLNIVIVWMFLPEELHSKPKEKESPKAIRMFAFVDTFRDLDWRNMWDLFLVRFLMGFAVMVYRSNFVLNLEYKYQAAATTTGYITSYSSIVGTASGFLVGKIASVYQNDSKLLLHAGVLQLAALVCLTFSPSLLLFVVALTPLSMANQVARVCSTNLTIARGRGQKKGTLLGLGGSIIAFARMLSPTLGGFAQEYHTSGPTMLGSIFAGFGVFTMLVVPEPWIDTGKLD